MMETLLIFTSTYPLNINLQQNWSTTKSKGEKSKQCWNVCAKQISKLCLFFYALWSTSHNRQQPHRNSYSKCFPTLKNL